MKKVNIFIEAFGRRKESTVRVRLYQLKGKESLAFNETKINNGDILIKFKNKVRPNDDVYLWENI